MANRHHRNGWTLVINLAREPRRNRRPYRFMVIGLSLLILAATVVLVLFNLKSLAQFRELRQANQGLEEKKTALTDENRQLGRELDNLRRRYREPVDEINSLLERKSFSWVLFFNRIEEALPPGSFLQTLNPPTSLASREFRARVALSSREELAQLIKNLQLQKFEEVRVLNENYQNNKFQVEMTFRDARVD
ncbi:MAG: hypothetical protein QHH43_02810 [Candidatus Saccharicenans sp.]|nr:hypothetical protein [Candidatus Saccharicenans sp.]